MPSSIISPSDLAILLKDQSDIELLDVRTPVEFQELHVAGAKNVPLDQLDVQAIASRDPNRPVYLICQKGSRGRQACERFAAAGWTRALNVEGGTLACEQAGLPMIRGKKAISLERQVRIAAGSLVLTGVVLAWLVHPAFVLLLAFVGAGLVFAGVTDTCGMGMLLARMPWNQTADINATRGRDLPLSVHAENRLQK